jgi:hypothetical protein
MKITSDSAQLEPANFRKVSSWAFFIDLAIYLPVMFLIREVYLSFWHRELLWE